MADHPHKINPFLKASGLKVFASVSAITGRMPMVGVPTKRKGKKKAKKKTKKEALGS